MSGASLVDLSVAFVSRLRAALQLENPADSCSQSEFSTNATIVR